VDATASSKSTPYRPESLNLNMDLGITSGLRCAATWYIAFSAVSLKLDLIVVLVVALAAWLMLNF
jgi:hypothetical protein